MSTLSSSSAICFFAKSPSSSPSSFPPPSSSSSSSYSLKNSRVPFSRPAPVRVINESRGTEVSQERANERSEADELVDKIDFGELCNEFECISSPFVESTARQLARDILEFREGNRALGTYSVTVKYKDPVRAFTGRNKYKRQLWLTGALDKPSVSVQEMMMLSTSVLNIKWTVRGRPKSVLASVGGDLIIRINSVFTLNQISGQVLEHEESWDVSASSIIAQAYFWSSRRLYAVTESGKDIADGIIELTNQFSKGRENLEIYPDPTGDPTKVSCVCLQLQQLTWIHAYVMHAMPHKY
ncbi:unnamed protein product [Victoria cruziana]